MAPEITKISDKNLKSNFMLDEMSGCEDIGQYISQIDKYMEKNY